MTKTLNYLQLKYTNFKMACLRESSKIFLFKANIYNLQKFQELSTSTKNTVNFGMETISYRGPQLWNLISNNIKAEPTLELFKKKIRK